MGKKIIISPGKNTREFVRDFKTRHGLNRNKAEEDKQWCIDNPERLRIYQLKRRDTTLGTILNGERVRVKVNKRPWPGHCELCGRDKSEGYKEVRLGYHHWDDSDMSKGLWLCATCHIFAEIFDNSDMVSSYMKLKRMVREAPSIARLSRPISLP